LNENEISQLPESEAMKVSFVSKRWAAKEAVAKAFGTGIGAELSFLDMEISHQQSGKPIVELNSRAQKLAQKKGISKFHLSISDEKNYAVAFVVASAD